MTWLNEQWPRGFFSLWEKASFRRTNIPHVCPSGVLRSLRCPLLSNEILLMLSQQFSLMKWSILICFETLGQTEVDFKVQFYFRISSKQWVKNSFKEHGITDAFYTWNDALVFECCEQKYSFNLLVLPAPSSLSPSCISQILPISYSWDLTLRGLCLLLCQRKYVLF